MNQPRVIFATLGRLIEVTVERDWLNLHALKIFIMDEADKLVTKMRKQPSEKRDYWQNLAQILDQVPTNCTLAAFSATYQPHTLEVIEKRFGPETVHLIASEASESQSSQGKVPENIKVVNLELPEAVTK